ncbi:MAG: ABC transporter ATP-binding protein [bacterium]
MNNTPIPTDLKTFIWSFIKPHKIKIILMGFLSLVFAFEFSIKPYFLKIVINKIANNPPAESYFSLLLWPIIAYVIIFFVFSMSYMAWDWISLKTFPIIRTNIVTRMVDYTHSHSYEYFQNNFAGNIANKIANDITNGVENIIQLLFSGILTNFLAFISGVIALTIAHVYFGLASFLWSIIYLIGYTKLNKKLQQLSKILATSRSKLTGVIVDSFTNANNVKLFASKDYEATFIGKYIQDVYERDNDFRRAVFYRRFFSTCLNTILSIVMLILLVYTKQRDLITVGDFALVLTLSFLILDILKSLSKDYTNLSKETGICNQALSVITTPHKINDTDKVKPLEITQGKIAFNSVTFSYAESNNLFHNLSVVIPGGQKVALVGYSGSAKSTFVNLIVRLFDVQKGEITIDNQKITHVTQDSLRKNVGFIPQDPILFHRTLMDNIRYGKAGASDEEVIEAAKKAHAHEFIVNTPEGYNSLVGDRGIKLSGGQRQRVAIARAILKNAPILILDEATCALDSVTENLIQDSLSFLMKDKTAIVIAHRLSTISNMDRILVFDKGKIAEDGTNESLLAKKGTYWLLWHTQFANYLKTM